jgi:predicted TPR repeat methyltransferase
LATTAEQIGEVTIAHDAYREVLRRDPQNHQAQSALSQATRDKKLLDAFMEQSPSKTMGGTR